MEHMVIRCKQTIPEMIQSIKEHCCEFERLLEDGSLRDLEWELGYLTALAQNGYGEVMIDGESLSDKVEAYTQDEVIFIRGE